MGLNVVAASDVIDTVPRLSFSETKRARAETLTKRALVDTEAASML